MTKVDPKLILASGSPQRRQLLEHGGYDFDIVVPSPGAECGLCSQESPAEFVARMACQKAIDVAQQLGDRQAPGRWIVACDTVAECQGVLLGKPADRGHARQMLERLSGRVHHVYSGLCLRELDTATMRVRVASTTLQMDRLSTEQIQEYLDSGQWEGKAGAFGYQDRVGWLHVVEGSESNVIGLPMELLAAMLADVRSG
jgi:septum formation protein